MLRAATHLSAECPARSDIVIASPLSFQARTSAALGAPEPAASDSPGGSAGQRLLRHRSAIGHGRGNGASLTHRPHPTDPASAARPGHGRLVCHGIQMQLDTSSVGGAGGCQPISDLQTCLEWAAAAAATFPPVQTRQKPNPLVITDLKQQELLHVAVAHIRKLRTRTESQTRAADRRHSGSNCCKCENHAGERHKQVLLPSKDSPQNRLQSSSQTAASR